MDIRFNIISDSYTSQMANGPSKVIANTIKGLNKIGYPFELNKDIRDFPNNWIHDSVKGIIEVGLNKIPSVIGPNVVVLPRDLPLFRPKLKNCIYLHPSQWCVDVWEKVGFSECMLRLWPAGIDIDDFNVSREADCNNVMIYFMLDPPAGLFPSDFNYGLPFIKGVNLRFIELFVYVAFFKAIRQKNRFQSVFIRPFQLLLILTIILLVYTLFLNSSFISIIKAAKWIFIWSLIYSIPKLIDSYDEWIFFFRMAFIIVFIAFLSQLLQLALGYSPSYLLGTSFSPMMDYGQGEFVLPKMDTSSYNLAEARPISSSSIIVVGLIGAMFFQQYKRDIFPSRYLYLVIIISYVSILLTATRGWFIAFSFVIFIYMVFIRKIKRSISVGIFVVLLIPLFVSIPFLRKQLAGSVKRLTTIEIIAGGDFSAGGTSSRVDYSIELMKLWKESPMLGWGFSEFYKENSNGHAGLANLIFSVGIIGFLIFIYFWYKLFFIPITADKRISAVNPYKGSLIIFSLSFFIFFILNATSGQQFGIYVDFGGGTISQIVYYSFSSFSITMAFNSEVITEKATSR